ncbi:MAG: ArsR family transcriptional regulator [Thermoprotei archaeon]|nr:MAG: ArsR family transcriptional regulator [Thermoprotei archaeon]RLF24224.1 MAG: ArsR family transcriptional regulator [Thermoprotei archaeon]
MRQEDKALPVEEVLSSKGRIRILRILAEKGELNISEIARRAELNHSATLAHLESLKRAGLVEEKNFGRIRIFRFREEDPRAKALKELFKVFEEYRRSYEKTESSS